MTKFHLLLIAFLSSSSLLLAQYQEWTLIGQLPEETIEDLQIISESELIVLTKGIIYYSSDLGSNWSKLIETIGDSINSIKADNSGNFYYQNQSGLYKQRIGEAANKIEYGSDFYKLSLVQGDTLIMHNTKRFLFSFDSGQNWLASQDLGQIGNEYFDKLLIRGTSLYFNTDTSLMTYDLSSSQVENISSRITLNTAINSIVYSVSKDSSILLNLKNFGNFNEPIDNPFRSIDNGSSFQTYEPIGIPPSWNTYVSDLYEIEEGVISLTNNWNTGLSTILINKTYGLQWEEFEIFTNVLDHPENFYYNTNSSFAFITSELGKLYMSSSQPTSTKSFDFLKEKPLEIYPNPTQDFCYIKYAEHFKPTKISVYNASGLLIRQLKASPTIEIISLKDLPRGQYNMIFNNEKAESQTATIIKE